MATADGGVFPPRTASSGRLPWPPGAERPECRDRADPRRARLLAVASDGGSFAFGDATSYGFEAARTSRPDRRIAPPRAGFRLLALASRGDLRLRRRQFYGSMGGTHLNQPVVASPLHERVGYWLRRLRRRDLRLRLTPTSTVPWEPSTSISRSSGWRLRPAVMATGWWRGTGSSTSGAPPSPALRSDHRCGRRWASPRRSRFGRATRVVTVRRDLRLDAPRSAR